MGNDDYAWEVNYRSFLFIKVVDGKIPQEEKMRTYEFS